MAPNAVQTPARLVPWQPVAAAFATSVDWPVLVPVPPPAGWESTSARIEPTLDRAAALQHRWITSDQQYAALEQSDTADIRYVGSKTADGAASGAPYLAGGRTWDRLVSADGATRSLVQVAEPSTGAQGRLTYVVTGSAPWSELEALASSLSPLPVRPAASPSELVPGPAPVTGRRRRWGPVGNDVRPDSVDLGGDTAVGRSGMTIIGATRVTAAVLSAFALVLTGASAWGWHTLQSIEGNLTVAPDLGGSLSPAGEGAVDEQTGRTAEDILIVGSDTRTGQGPGFGDAAKTASGNGHSDTTILLHISADRTRAFGVSIPRDSLVVRPGCTSSGKIEGMAPRALFNTAYAVGGRKCVIAAVKYLTGVKVNHFVEVDFLGFQKIVDALGGVTIDACTRLRDPLFQDAAGGWHGSGLDIPKGVNTLDGEKALQFVRARNLNGGDDRDRIHRQQQFLSSIIRTASESGLLTDPPKLIEVLNAIAGSLTVDPGLSGDGLNEFLLSIAGMKPGEIHFYSVPTKGAPDGSSLLWLTDEADRCGGP